MVKVMLTGPASFVILPVVKDISSYIFVNFMTNDDLERPSEFITF